MSWRISGTYFESCNCDAICPCRRTDGAPGGRSTHGTCIGVLSWVIDEGSADGVDLSGLPVAMAVRYRRRRARFAVELDPVSRCAGRRRPAGHARGDLHRPARRRRARSLPVGLEGEQPHRRALARHRGRPHLTSPVAADPRPRERPHPRPLRRRRDGQLRHPRPRAARRGARRGRARGRGRPARLQLSAATAATARPSTTRASPSARPGRVRRVHPTTPSGTPGAPRMRRRGSPGSTCPGTSPPAGRSISSSGGSGASTRISSSAFRPTGSTRWPRRSGELDFHVVTRGRRRAGRGGRAS